MQQQTSSTRQTDHSPAASRTSQVREEAPLAASVQLQPMEEEEEEMQPKLQLQPMEEEEEMLQAKSDAAPVRAAARSGFQGAAGAYPYQGRIQEAFGSHDISTAQAYTDSHASAANRSMGAMAYTVGNKVAFRGYPSLHTAAHEAAHIVQQRAGVQLKGGIGEKGDVYERHADAVADRVVQGKSAEDLLNRRPIGGGSRAPVIQRITVNSESGDLGDYWDMYVYPGHANPGYTAADEANLRPVGRQVRGVQSLNNRPITNEGGHRIAHVNSSSLDRGDPAFGDTQNATAAGVNTWDITLETYHLFDPIPSVDDVLQVNLGDCYLLATVQSLASKAGGRTTLMNMMRYSGSQIQVDFHRLEVARRRAVVHPTDMVRITLNQRYDNQGVDFHRKGPFPLPQATAYTIAQAQHGAAVQATDTFNVTWHKNVIWPWAIERAYAAAAGSYAAIDGGFASVPMMAITGEMAYSTYDIAGASETELGVLLWMLGFLQDDADATTAGTPSTLPQPFSHTFHVNAADPVRGVRLGGFLDGLVTPWIPWEEFEGDLSSFHIINLGNLLVPGASVITHSSSIAPAAQRAALIAAVAAGNTVIGRFQTAEVGAGYVLVSSHEYAVTSMSSANMNILNPWGNLHPGLLSLAQVLAGYTSITFTC